MLYHKNQAVFSHKFLFARTAIYPATTLTPMGQSLPQPPQVIQQHQQREGEGERFFIYFAIRINTTCMMMSE